MKNIPRRVTVTLVLLLISAGIASGQCNSGLHAGIRAEIVPLKEGFTAPAHVELTFLLLNDSTAPLDVHAGSWKIVVDGKELKDSDYILGNGPMPGGVATPH